MKLNCFFAVINVLSYQYHHRITQSVKIVSFYFNVAPMF